MGSQAQGAGRGVVVRHRRLLVADVLTRALELAGVPLGGSDPLLVAETGPADVVLDGSGPVTTRHELADLHAALGHLQTGRQVVVEAVTTPVLARLTDRERQILGLIAGGANNESMAGSLGISPHTVRTHVQNLLGKLGADSRLAAAALARRHGLASTP